MSLSLKKLPLTNYMKKLLLFLWMTIWALTAFAQPVAVIPSPPNFDGYQHGYRNYYEIEYNGAFYFMYEDNSGHNSLAKYDGTNLTIIPHLNGLEYAGHPIVYGGYLYLKYESISFFNSFLARWDGTNMIYINSPSGFGARGYEGFPIIYQGNLMLAFQSDGGDHYLMKYDGNFFTYYQLSGYEFDFYHPLVIVGNTLYARYVQNGPNGIGALAKFNGSTLTLVPNPPNQTTMGRGLIASNVFILGGNIHLRYRENSGLYSLLKYDGTTLTTIATPVGHSYVDDFIEDDDPYLFQGKAYLRFLDTNGAYYLAEYDGNVLTQIVSPIVSQGNGYGYFGCPIGIDSTLYLRYTASPTSYLAKYEMGVVSEVPSTGTSDFRGSSINYDGNLAGAFQDPLNRSVLGVCDGDSTRIIPQPVGFQQSFDFGYKGRPIVYSNYLYMWYEVNYDNHLARYGGQNIVSLPNPTGFENNGYTGHPIILGNTLFLQFEGNDYNLDLAKLDSCGNSFAAITPTTCSTYTAADGQVYNSSGTYTAIVPNMYGCDSVISIQLTLLPSTSATISANSCDTYTAPDGQVYTASGNYQAIVPNMAGCDSLITIVLDIDSSTTSFISPTACRRYTAPNGSNYTNSGTFTSTIPNAQGCDSVITVQLTIVNVNTTVQHNGPNITSTAGGSTYQWLDCGNGLAPIVGATGQTYTASASGSYAVVVTTLGCADTSNCVNVTIVGGAETGLGSVKIFPNPTNSAIFVVATEELEYSLFALDGRSLETGKVFGTTRIDLDRWAAGFYLIRLEDDGGNVMTRRIVKTED